MDENTSKRNEIPLGPYVIGKTRSYIRIIRGKLLGGIGETVLVYENLMKRFHDHKFFLNHLGLVCFEGCNERVALKLWERVLSRDPTFSPAINNIATYYSHNGRPIESIKMIRRAIELDPHQAVHHYNLSNFYFVYRHYVRKEFGWSLQQIYRETSKEMKEARDLEPSNYMYAKEYANVFLGGRSFWSRT